MSAIWDASKLNGTALLLVLALADYANEDGVCWPSIPTLAKKARISERQTQRLLQELETGGHIAIDKNAGPKGVNLYTVRDPQSLLVVLTATPQKTQRKGGVTLATPDIAVSPVTSGAQSGDIAVSPKPSLNHQNNIEEGVPSSPRKRAARVRDPRLDTPAMRCVFSVVKHYPHNGLLDKVIAVLGENPNRARLQACYEAWLAKGWNPKAWTWLTEWYVAGGPPKYASGNGCSASPDPPPKPKPSGPVVILNPLTGKREVIDGNGSTAGRESTSSR